MENARIYELNEDVEITDELVEAINDFLSLISLSGARVNVDRLQELIKMPHLEIFMMEIDGRPIGMGTLQYVDCLTKKSGYIHDVGVHKDFQGKGLGKKITNHLIERAKKKGLKYLELTSSPKKEAANKFYKKFGFEPRETNVYRLKIEDIDKK
ncbi:MAG: GNAT family N-acetyltransferase [Patescibacteria group bacterium]|nr:GNAT family N-acetyltransferase [Patescibacteria group bacterium]